jgi:hypothetical protein
MKDLEQKLIELGYKKNSCSYHDYESAKATLGRGMGADEYCMLCVGIAGFLGV